MAHTKAQIEQFLNNHGKWPFVAKISPREPLDFITKDELVASGIEVTLDHRTVKLTGTAAKPTITVQYESTGYNMSDEHIANTGSAVIQLVKALKAAE